ncbi:MAG: hypothetical protein P8R42_06755 [Candidatus Binatia bacterium]|nr:hypothetical protein [Candidatus Binatia bacterium]
MKLRRSLARAVVVTLLALVLPEIAAAIPATPVMTVYRFNGALDVPFYRIDDFARRGTKAKRAGALAQGTSVVPCLVIRGGKPVTDAKGTPYVGFEVVVDSKKATPASTDRFRAVFAGRKNREVRNHHCSENVQHVVGIRNLYEMSKPPLFDPPPKSTKPPRPASELDAIVRAFHDSPRCHAAQSPLIGRRTALANAWTAFARDSAGRWPKASLGRARHLDYVVRTAIYEGHLDRGCSAYGSCERNVIALSIRNRARGACSKGQGCRYDGDFEGVASKVSQYNIWDEYLTQVSGLTSCFLRADLAQHERYTKLQRMYAQNQADFEKILFGGDADLAATFPGTAPSRSKSLRHYYHPPAMGKCFPGHERLEYMSGAVARKGSDFALLANTRIDVGRKRGSGYEFRSAAIETLPDRDVVRTIDDYPGFLVDARKVALRKASRCRPYGTPKGCRFESIGRHRKVPSWLTAGKPIEFTCHVQSRGEACRSKAQPETTKVGGVCDIAMQPVAGVR